MTFYITNKYGDEIFDVIEAKGLGEACDFASNRYEDDEADVYYADLWEQLYKEGQF